MAAKINLVHHRYDSVRLARYGRNEFAQLCSYLNRLLPTRGIHDLDIHEELADMVFTRIKQVMVSLIWGDLFQTVGSSVLKITSGSSSGKRLSELDGDAFVNKFGIAENSSEFMLEEAFTIKLSTCESVLRVVLDETKLYDTFYENKMITDMFAREGCFISDFVFNMGGSEALAETYFGAMKH